MRILEKDIAILEYIGRHTFVTTSQIVAYHETIDDPIALRRCQYRLKKLRENSLVVRTSGLVMHPTSVMYSLTRTGMETVGLSGNVVVPRSSQILHDFHVVEIANMVATQRLGHELASEREIRRLETPINEHFSRQQDFSFDDNGFESARFSAKKLGSTGVMQRIYPDLASINKQGNSCLYEVENAKKDRKRLIKLMTSYANNPNIVEINYFVFDQALETVLESAARATQTLKQQLNTTKIRVIPYPRQNPDQQLFFD